MLRRRSLRRIACGAVVAATALSGLLVVAWTHLAYLDAAVEAIVFILIAVGGTAAAGRALGWARPGAVGAAVGTALLIADGLPVTVYEGALLTGGAKGIDGTPGVVPLSLTAAALAWSRLGHPRPGPRTALTTS